MTPWDLLVDASDGAKPEMVCLECADAREAEATHDEDWCECRHCRRAFTPKYASPPPMDFEPEWLREKE